MAVQVLLSLAILIISAKIFGEIAERLKIPSMAGEIFGGIVAGPVLRLVSPDAALHEIAGIGVLFIFFLMGLSIRFEKGELRSGSLLALSASLLSFAAGFLFAFQIYRDALIAAVAGAALLAASPSAAMSSIAAVGEYRTRVYKILVSAEISHGLLAAAAVSVLSLLITRDMQAVLLMLAAFAALSAAVFTVGPAIAKRFLSLFSFMKDEQIFLSIPLVVLFVAAFAAGAAGLAGLAGAFFAGAALRGSQITESSIMPKMKTVGHGFFVPLFFSYAAISLDFSSASLQLVLMLVLASLAGNAAAYGLAGKFLGLKGRESRTLGLATLPKAECAIIIAQTALAAAFISQGVYTSLVLFAFLSIVLAPLLLRVLGKGL